MTLFEKDEVKTTVVSNNESEILRKLIEKLDELSKLKKPTGEKLAKLVSEIAWLATLLPHFKHSIRMKNPQIAWHSLEILGTIAKKEFQSDLLKDKKLSQTFDEIYNLAFNSAQGSQTILKELAILQKELCHIENENKQKEAKTLDELISLQLELKEEAEAEIIEESELEEENYNGLDVIRNITSFYQDIVSLYNIQNKLSSSSQVEVNKTKQGYSLTGLIILIGEEVKRLSIKTKTQLASVGKISFHGHELTLLNRLWMYKNGRDAIRHSPDYINGQTEDLKNIMNDPKQMEDLVKEMLLDSALVEGYITNKFMPDVEKFNNVTQKKNKDIERLKLLENKQADKKEKSKKENKKNENTKENTKIEVVENVGSFKHNISEAVINKISEILSTNAKKQYKNFSAEEINKYVTVKMTNLMQFLKTGNPTILCPDFETIKNDASLRNKKLTEIRVEYEIFKAMNEFKKEIMVKNTNKTSNTASDQKNEVAVEKIDFNQFPEIIFLQNLLIFFEEAFIGRKVKVKSEEPVTKEEKDEKNPWSTNAAKFLNEISDEILTNLKGNFPEDQYILLTSKGISSDNKSEITLFRYLFREFISKGFTTEDNVEIPVMPLIRKIAKLEEEKYDKIFELLKDKNNLSAIDISILKEIKTKIGLAIGIFNKAEQLAEMIKNSKIKWSKEEVEKYWSRVVKQFESFFSAEEKTYYRKTNPIFIPVSLRKGQNLQPWEEKSKEINDTVLRIRMLHPSRYESKQKRSTHIILVPNAITKFQLKHINKIRDLLSLAKETLNENTIVLINAKTIGDILMSLQGGNSYLITSIMALISEHITKIANIAVNYILPYMEKCAINKELLNLYKNYLLLLREYGNKFAHADIKCPQSLLKDLFEDKQFSTLLKFFEDLEHTIIKVNKNLNHLLANVHLSISKSLQEIMKNGHSIDTQNNEQLLSKKWLSDEKDKVSNKIKKMIENAPEDQDHKATVKNALVIKIMHHEFEHTISKYGSLINEHGIFNQKVDSQPKVENLFQKENSQKKDNNNYKTEK